MFSPVFLPVYFFALAILAGAALLHSPPARAEQGVSWLDAFFTSVSATCVTGLTTVDTASVYSGFGQTVIAALIQIGGLGVMTYSSLIFYMLRQRVTLTDRIAVGQFLLNDPGFQLGRFLKRMVFVCLCIEGIGAFGLRLGSLGEMSWGGAFFHAVSVFCNAGFSLYPGSMTRYADNFSVNIVLMTLIICGGLGFYVLVELPGFFAALVRKGKAAVLSWQSTVVIQTSLYLILGGWVVFFLLEKSPDVWSGLLTALFQSVSARTAGFNTVDIGAMTDASLFVLILLMLVGGSPGSCAGGIKTTTLRVLLLRRVPGQGPGAGVVRGCAMDSPTISKAMTVLILAAVLILGSVFVLSMTEGADISHQLVRGKFIEIFFEAVSAFGTVGLSTGLTPRLSDAGKVVIMALMFVGRLGPIVFLIILQSWQDRELFRRPERSMLIG